MYNNDTAAVIRRLKQLQAQFENDLESGKTFDEVRSTYLEIKLLTDRLGQSKTFNMELRNQRSEKSAGGSYSYD